MFLSEVKVILDLLQDRKTDSEADASMTPLVSLTVSWHIAERRQGVQKDARIRRHVCEVQR